MSTGTPAGQPRPTMLVMETAGAGGVEQLRPARRPRPEPAPTEVLVRVSAAGINPVDWKTRAGDGVAGLLGPPPWVLGWDVSGVVEQIGAGVTRFAPGDRVFGMPRFPREAGGYGQYVVAPSRHFAATPDSMTDVEAAALPLAGLTAWQSLHDTAKVRPGQRVLIHAAAGGVGHLAVQIAKHLKAHVLATASAGKAERLRQLGADEVVDYTAVDFTHVVEPVDVVLDLVGGEYADRSLDVLAPGGLLLEIPSGQDVPTDERLAATGTRARSLLVEPDGAALEQLAQLYEAGLLAVDVARTARLEQVADLHEEGARGRTAGKLVARLTLSDQSDAPT